jgi:hypothetical protein
MVNGVFLVKKNVSLVVDHHLCVCAKSVRVFIERSIRVSVRWGIMKNQAILQKTVRNVDMTV